MMGPPIVEARLLVFLALLAVPLATDAQQAAQDPNEKADARNFAFAAIYSRCIARAAATTPRGSGSWTSFTLDQEWQLIEAALDAAR
jgi:hypothetical protein